MTRAWPHWAWRALQVLVGAAILALVLRHIGAGPFVAGVHAIDGTTVVAALLITGATTVCCAWRWRLVVRAFGGELAWPAAIAAYYRSQFLDATLPGGVVGDVVRGVRRGRATSHLGRGLRAVFWERMLGQAVQVALAIALLLALPSPLRAAVTHRLPEALAALVAALLLLALLAKALPTRWKSALVRMAVELARIGPAAWIGIVVASGLAVAGYTAIFVLAVHATGTATPITGLLSLVMLILVAAAIPANLAGFGPREGAAAWAFAAAGLGAQHGVAAAIAYGVLGWIACAPGAVLWWYAWLRAGVRRTRA